MQVPRCRHHRPRRRRSSRYRIVRYDSEQRTGRGVRHAIERDPIDMPRQAHAMLYGHLEDARRLEAKFDQPRRDRERLVARVMIVGKVGGHLTDGAVLIPPRPLQHPVGRAVEVDAVDVLGLDGRSGRGPWSRAVRRFGGVASPGGRGR